MKTEMKKSDEFKELVSAIYLWECEIESIQNKINQSSLYLLQNHNFTSKFESLRNNQLPQVNYSNYEY